MKEIALPVRIEGTRLLLKKLELRWSKMIFDVIEKERERLSVFLSGIRMSKTLEDQEAYIKKTEDSWDSMISFDYAIFLQGEETYIGNIGIHSISWKDGRGEIGYWISQEFEGKGYISESIELLEKILFSLGFHRLEIRCSPLNEKSVNVAKRLHYRQEGHLRENILEEDVYRDTFIFAKLASERS